MLELLRAQMDLFIFELQVNKVGNKIHILRNKRSQGSCKEWSSNLS